MTEKNTNDNVHVKVKMPKAPQLGGYLNHFKISQPEFFTKYFFNCSNNHKMNSCTNATELYQSILGD